ncbi:hypothetical protein A7P61_15850 [Pantoea agglomerans pv. betae]|jgi:hypothetical protein|nr:MULTISPECIES: hypothetical protein [Pantoea]WHU86193.1 hypothetical protein A7P61_15850 [Pantoea agglomerans pv. betae]
MRYLDDDGSINAWATPTINNKVAPVTYFGFKKFDSGSEARDAFQIKGLDKTNKLDPRDKSWSDARLRGDFDTLQLYENGVPQVRHPRMYGDKIGAPLEPFTAAYPKFGKGGVEQMYAENRMVHFDEVNILPEE